MVSSQTPNQGQGRGPGGYGHGQGKGKGKGGVPAQHMEEEGRTRGRSYSEGREEGQYPMGHDEGMDDRGSVAFDEEPVLTLEFQLPLCEDAADSGAEDPTDMAHEPPSGHPRTGGKRWPMPAQEASGTTAKRAPAVAAAPPAAQASASARSTATPAPSSVPTPAAPSSAAASAVRLKDEADGVSVFDSFARVTDKKYACAPVQMCLAWGINTWH